MGTGLVEPVPDARAAVASLGGDDAAAERALVIADYHAGYEAALRYERGVDVPSRAGERRERLLDLLDRTGADRLVVCGDLMHSIGDPGGAERGELEVLFESLPPDLPVTLVKGNHDGAVESWLGDALAAADGSETPAGDADAADDRLTIVSGHGTALGSGTVGVCHGHTWPAPAVLGADVVCMGHEHPCVRLEDEVGGSRVEPVWLRGPLQGDAFAGRTDPSYDGVGWLSDAADGDDGHAGADGPPDLIVVPAFNDLVGGTWINVPGQEFLAPFLPAGLRDGEGYLLDGTRLGPYRSI